MTNMIRRSESYWIRGIWNVTAGWLNGFHSNHTNIMRNCWQWKARPPMVSLLAWFERTVSSYEVERGQPMSLSLKIMAKNLWFNTKFNTSAGKIEWTEKYIFLTVLFRMGEKTFFYQCVCVKCRNYKNIEKVAKMRGMEKIIMSNFPVRST